MLLIVDKLPELVKTQVEAVKGIKIDNVTVWDSGSGTQTPNFISGLMNSVPPLENLFKIAGMELPEFLGKKKEIKEVVVDPIISKTK
jgi:flotillin